ncbi:MAG TPA: MFS transporter [Candidatus Poseidoniales archaeon]|nr:MAG TPA: MFS transporter [Candidatus Poseidoniales archaeon]HII20586.1 MFS transporter [Poseidonia sp.]
MSSERDAGKGALLALFLVTMIDMIGFGIIIPFLTYLVQDLAEADGVVRIGLWVGLLMTAYSAAQFLFSPFWGSLSDRIGRRPVLMIGLVGNTVFFTAFGFSTTLLFALSMRFLAGVFNGNIAVARAYIGDVSSPKQLATRMGLIGAAFGLGFTIGPFIGGEFSNPAERWNLFVGTVFDTYPYLLPCAIASALSAGSLVLAYYKLPESIDVEALKNNEDERPWGQRMFSMAANSASMLRTPSIGAMIWVSMLFIFGFTVMHSVFILYTEMAVGLGGLGFSEQDNGRIFAMIGLFGILTQAVLIGPLTRRYGTRRLIPISVLLTGIGLTLIPYTQSSMAWIQMLLVVSCIAIGNGVFQPSSSTYLTRIARDEGYDLGVVMGAQESLSAFARIFGPLSGGLVWELTVNGSYPWDYHTAFHLCGVLMVISAILTLRLPPLKQFDEAE